VKVAGGVCGNGQPPVISHLANALPEISRLARQVAQKFVSIGLPLRASDLVNSDRPAPRRTGRGIDGVSYLRGLLYINQLPASCPLVF